VSLQGCYGKMSLTRKVYKLNGEVSDKYLRSFLTWVFVLAPVYAASVPADFMMDRRVATVIWRRQLSEYIPKFFFSTVCIFTVTGAIFHIS